MLPMKSMGRLSLASWWPRRTNWPVYGVVLILHRALVPQPFVIGLGLHQALSLQGRVAEIDILHGK